MCKQRGRGENGTRNAYNRRDTLRNCCAEYRVSVYSNDINNIAEETLTISSAILLVSLEYTDKIINAEVNQKSKRRRRRLGKEELRCRWLRHSSSRWRTCKGKTLEDLKERPTPYFTFSVIANLNTHANTRSVLPKLIRLTKQRTFEILTNITEPCRRIQSSHVSHVDC